MSATYFKVIVNSAFKIINTFTNKSSALLKLTNYIDTYLYVIKFLDKGSKIDAATPGLSTTPIKVIFESFLVNEIPVIIFSLIRG